MSISEEVKNLSKNGIWYQDFSFFGASMPVSYPEHLNDSCYHYGKWVNFIKPLLDKTDMPISVFTEIGCNAGLYLLCAQKYGFQNLYGYEADADFYKQAEWIKAHYSLDSLKLIRGHVGTVVEPNTDPVGSKSIGKHDLYLSDVVLLANTTYWIDDAGLTDLFETLKLKCRWLLIVTAENAVGCSSGSSSCIKSKLKDWKFIGEVSKLGYTRPMTSMLFKSKCLIVRNIDQLEADLIDVSSDKIDLYLFFKIFARFVREILHDPDSVYCMNQYEHFLISRGGLGGNHKKEYLHRYVLSCRDLILSLKNNGMKEALWEFEDHVSKVPCLDGHHRLVIQDVLGFRSVYTTTVKQR